MTNKEDIIRELFGDNHSCDKCDKTGHCAIENAARYFGENNEDISKFDAIIELFWEDFYSTLVHDCLTEPEKGIKISFAIGFVAGRGFDLIHQTPGPIGTKELLDILGKVADIGVQDEQDERSPN